MVADEQYSWDLSFPSSKSEFSLRKLAFADQPELNQRTDVALPRSVTTFGVSMLVLCLLRWRWTWRQGRFSLDGQLVLGLPRGEAWTLPVGQGSSEGVGTDRWASGDGRRVAEGWQWRGRSLRYLEACLEAVQLRRSPTWLLFFCWKGWTASLICVKLVFQPLWGADYAE